MEYERDKKYKKKSFEVSGADDALFREVGGRGEGKLSRSNLPKNAELVAELTIWPLSRLIVRFERTYRRFFTRPPMSISRKNAQMERFVLGFFFAKKSDPTDTFGPLCD